MIEICMLGTGAMMPIPGRALSAGLLSIGGRQWLLDCGEGTQLAIRTCGWSMAKIDAICFSHYHADHVAGLPGLLLTMGTMGRTRPVQLIGPTGLREVVNGLRVIAPELAFELEFCEIEGETYATEMGGARLRAFRQSHLMPCYGYVLELERAGKFDVARAQALNIPLRCWNALQRGQSVAVGGQTITPDKVLGPARKGLKLAYCTDTRPVEAIVQYAKDADLLICEGTYGDGALAEKASQYGHMTFEQAATLAKQANVRSLLLTHFSPAMPNPEDFLPQARRIFEHTDVAHDGIKRTLRFEQ